MTTIRNRASFAWLLLLAAAPPACEGEGPPVEHEALALGPVGGPLPPQTAELPTRGPLRVRGDKPMFEDATGRPVWLTGMSVAGADIGKTYGWWPLVSPWALQELADHFGNYVHIRLGPHHRDQEGAEYEAYCYDTWLEEYDLDCWNGAFWDRVHSTMSYARARGIYVEVDLVDSWPLKNRGIHPWHDSENMNGVNYDCGAPLPPHDTHIVWLQKIVDEIGSYDNVIFQVGNETSECGFMNNVAWHQLVVGTVEARLGPNRPRIFAANAHDLAIENQAFIDYVNRHNPVWPPPAPPIAIDLMWDKPGGVNEYGTSEPDVYAEEMWEAFVRGTYMHYWWGDDGDPERIETLRRIYYFHYITSKLDLAAFDHPPLDPGRLVGHRGHEYIGFLPSGGTLHIADLGTASDRFDVRWYDVSAMKLRAAETVQGGAGRDVTSPGGGMWVVHVVRAPVPGGSWLDETFDRLQNGPLHLQGGWTRVDHVPEVVGFADKMVVIDPPAGKTTKIDRNVPVQQVGLHRFDFRVKVEGASPGVASLAKVQLDTIEHPDGWNKKLQIIAGDRIRVNWDWSAETLLVPPAEMVQGRWYRIRCELDLPNGAARIFVDDVLKATFAMRSGPITHVQLDGWVDLAGTGSVAFDDLRGGVVAFFDVPPWHAFYGAIGIVRELGIANGCSASPPYYCPDAPTTRGEAAPLVLRARDHAGAWPPDPVGLFADVPVAHPNARWIEQLYNEGITGGCATNPLRYCPDDPATRKQAAVFLLRALHGAAYVPPAATGIFADVPATDPFAPWIEALYHQGITSGCAADPLRFCPNDPTTRGQAAAFVVSAFDLP